VAARAEAEQLEDLAPLPVGLTHRREPSDLEHVEEDARDRDAGLAVQDSAGESLERRQTVVSKRNKLPVEDALDRTICVLGFKL